MEKTLAELRRSHRGARCPFTAGEDKPLKYPTIFNSADIAVITKSDYHARQCCQAHHSPSVFYTLRAIVANGLFPRRIRS